jgi:hypothetical protein
LQAATSHVEADMHAGTDECRLPFERVEVALSCDCKDGALAIVGGPAGFACTDPEAHAVLNLAMAHAIALLGAACLPAFDRHCSSGEESTMHRRGADGEADPLTGWSTQQPRQPLPVEGRTLALNDHRYSHDVLLRHSLHSARARCRHHRNSSWRRLGV